MHIDSLASRQCEGLARRALYRPGRALSIQRNVHRQKPRRARVVPCSASDYNQNLQQPRVDDLEFSRLLTGPADIEQGRARSASDAGVLRRKGRLKEQDQFIDFIVSMHKTHSCEEVMTKVQRWVQARARLHIFQQPRVAMFQLCRQLPQDPSHLKAYESIHTHYLAQLHERLPALQLRNRFWLIATNHECRNTGMTLSGPSSNAWCPQ